MFSSRTRNPIHTHVNARNWLIAVSSALRWAFAVRCLRRPRSKNWAQRVGVKSIIWRPQTGPTWMAKFKEQLAYWNLPCFSLNLTWRVGNPVVRHRRLDGYVSSLLSFEIPILIQDASVINENFDLFIISIPLLCYFDITADRWVYFTPSLVSR